MSIVTGAPGLEASQKPFEWMVGSQLFDWQSSVYFESIVLYTSGCCEFNNYQT